MERECRLLFNLCQAVGAEEEAPVWGTQSESPAGWRRRSARGPPSRCGPSGSSGQRVTFSRPGGGRGGDASVVQAGEQTSTFVSSENAN